MLECRCIACAGRGEKGVQVKFVKLSGTGDGQQLVGHLIGQQPHLREGTVGIALVGMLGRERSFGALLVGIGPVEYLFFDELAGGERLERCAGQIEIGPRGDWQKLGFTLRQDAQILVHVLKIGGVFEACFLLGYGGILAFEQLLAVSRHAPKWYSSKTTKSQLVVCTIRDEP